jgi:hypothetical protein
MTDKTEFAVLFQWPEGVAVEENPRHVLDALTLPQAKMQAAMLYAGTAFKATPPNGYRLLQHGLEVHRYPVASGRAAQIAA